MSYSVQPPTDDSSSDSDPQPSSAPVETGETSSKLTKIVLTKDIVIIILALLAFVAGLYQTIAGIIQESLVYDKTRRCNGGLGYRYHDANNISINNDLLSETTL